MRRVSAGEVVEVLDGRGWSALASFEPSANRPALVRITETLPPMHRESSVDLTLAIGVLKSDRFEWVVEKTTELGVKTIRPFESTHSVARPSAAKQRRWQQIALGAVKQCGRSVPPTIHSPSTFSEILTDRPSLRLLCSEHGSATPFSDFARRIEQPKTVTILVGPEGGLHEDEVRSALDAGYQAISLGERILRAETAAITAVALCEETFSRR